MGPGDLGPTNADNRTAVGSPRAAAFSVAQFAWPDPSGNRPGPAMAVAAGRTDTDRMGDCCERDAYDETFGDRFARRIARRYRKRGLDRTRRRVVDFLSVRGIEEATVLEIGGGIGEVHVELLRRGARAVTNLEISTSYEEQAAQLLDGSGFGDRVTRRFLDIASSPDEVEPADVVVLHRVVCCYPDYERLLSAAAAHARRLLVFSHPPRTPVTRLSFGFDNLMRGLRHNDFRAFVHPPESMVAVAQLQGMSLRYRHRGLAWTVVGFERQVSPTAAA
jgi:2-polyprenyl-3-methyl-5-hydroxy-6-metoxy-1,4-benzoquinol methylase